MALETLCKIAQSYFPAKSLSAVDFICYVFRNTKQQIKGYSYKQFSADLGFGANNYMHLICTRARPLTLKAAERVALVLQLKGPTRLQFFSMAQYERARTQRERELALAALIDSKMRASAHSLDKAQLEYFSEWYHPVIREMLSLPECNHSAEWIAERIFPRLKVEQVKESLKLMERIGYISWSDEAKRYKLNHDTIRTPAEVQSIGLVKYHLDMLDRAKEAVSTVPQMERDLSALTLTVAEKDVAEIKTKLQDFRKTLLTYANSSVEPTERVYQLNMQFFPFSEKGNK